jgi:hypothetical protein
MGSLSKKTKSSSTMNSTGTVTPNVPGFIQQPAQDFYGQVRSLLGGSGPASNPATANQVRGFNLASGLGVNSGVNQAMGATRNLLDYTPDQVEAGQLRDTDLTAYLNPHTSEVIDAAGRDFQHANELGLNALRAGTPTGAYGGSRSAISAGQLVGDNTRNFAGTIAALRQGGFDNAQRMALADITNLLSARTGNADRNLAGAGLRLGASNQLSGQALAQDENTRANMGAALGAGGIERDINAQNDPAQQRAAWLQQIAQLLGIDPRQFIGATTTQSGTQSGTQTQGPDWMQLIGQSLQAAGTAAASDARLKRDIEYAHTDGSGLRWWRYRYLWDADDAPLRLGVMAQEAPAHAVITHPSGFLMVDYGAL